MKDLAVIILNWNGLHLLKQFLPTAAQHSITSDTDLIVADNGSTDESVKWVEDNFPQVKVLKLDKNYGFAEGYNKVINATRYRYTVLLNSDVEVTAGWTEPLLHYMRHNPDIGALQPKIRSWRDRNSFEYAGAAGGFLDKLGYPYCRGRLFASIEIDHGQYDGDPIDVCWASGAALMVDTELYLSVGGLDSRFFAHMEEIDLCCRIHAAGRRVMALSDAVVYHVGGASLEQGNPQKTYLNFRNNLLLLHKNMPAKEGRRKLFIRRLYDTLAWGMFILKFDFANANAILRAHRDFRRMKKLYTSHPDHNVLASLPGADRNIIIDYYLKRKKI